jgi:exonuclease SbcC
MKPEKLILENFGAYAGKTTIDFTVLDNIFLIAGKTGSGKTTIFDALCFALYGTVPGSRRGHISRLRSDYAVSEAECSVSLDFSLGEKRYRVVRSPKQEKPKKRGSGVTTIEESAELYELVKGNPLPLSGRKSEADSKIRELIGLEAEEFFKLILLPQGEFAEFLQQSTTERQKALGKLFPVDRAIRVRELAQEKFREAAAQTREAERAMNSVMERVSFDTYETVRARSEEALEQAKLRAVSLSEAMARYRKIAELAEGERQTAERLAGTREEEAAILAAEAETAEKDRTLARSRQAQPLRSRFILAEEKKKILEQAEADLAGAGADRAAAAETLAETEERRAAIPRWERELRELHEKRPALLTMAAEAEQIRSGRETLKKRAALIADLEEKRRELTAVLTCREEEIEELQALAGRSKEFEARWEEARRIKDGLLRLRQLSADAAAALRERDALAGRVKELEAQNGGLDRRIPVLREELAKLRREKAEGERADMAAHLAAELKPGLPCPVCGSPDHPRPAAAPAAVFSMDERIGSLEHVLEDAEKSLAASRTDHQVASRELHLVEERIKTLEKAAGEIFPEPPEVTLPAFPSETELDRMVEDQIKLLNAAVSRRDEAGRAGARIPGLYRERDALLLRRTELEKEQAGLAEKNNALEKTVAELEQSHARILREWALPGGAVLEELDGRIGELDQKIKSCREDWEAAGRNMAAAAARADSCLKQRQEAAERLGEAETALREMLAASPFADPEALRAAMLDGDTEARLENEIAQWKEGRSRIQSLAEEQERGLMLLRSERIALGPVPEEGAAGALAALEKELEQAGAERDRLAALLSSLEQDRARLEETHGRYDQLRRRAAALGALADDLSGKNPRKKSFDSWLLGRYLEKVAAFATRRLERMSDSRYSLLLDKDEPGRGRTGLDLAVYDSFTGKPRPCATLSGGESFLASISLALGLADSIQARSGGVRLDAIFIDEGFGSLDEGTLDKALLIMDELREHRMVGLISHVGELRARISSRIEVLKSGAGSRIAADA